LDQGSDTTTAALSIMDQRYDESAVRTIDDETSNSIMHHRCDESLRRDGVSEALSSARGPPETHL